VPLALCWPWPPVGAPSWGPPGCGRPPGHGRVSSLPSCVTSCRSSCRAPSWGLRRESSLSVRSSPLIASAAQSALYAYGAFATARRLVVRGGTTALWPGTRLHISSTRWNSAPRRPRLVLLPLGAQAAAAATRHVSTRAADTSLCVQPCRSQPSPCPRLGPANPSLCLQLHCPHGASLSVLYGCHVFFRLTVMHSCHVVGLCQWRCLLCEYAWTSLVRPSSNTRFINRNSVKKYLEMFAEITETESMSTSARASSLLLLCDELISSRSD
jgi:hypothetical protein